MKVLGIMDSHDAGVALVEDGKIVYAANEERFTRKKLFWGFPKEALSNLFEYTKTNPSEIDYVAMGSIGMVETSSSTGFDRGNVGLLRTTFEKASKLFGPLMASRFTISVMKRAMKLSRKNKSFVKSHLKKIGVDAPIKYLDHHSNHAASAYYTFGHKDALVITADGGGDGLSGTVYTGEDGYMEKITECPKIHSIGNFWDYITYICGFNPLRHGGKITGLAAYNPSPELYEKLRKYYGYSKEELHFINKKHLFWRESIKFLKNLFGDSSIEAISYAAQKVLEENMCGIIHEAVKKTGLTRVALAGGTFANVRLNQKLLELENVEEVYVHPHMGDGGLAVGAALNLYANIKKLKPFRLEDVYLGPSYNEEDILNACETNRVRYEKLSDPADMMASLLVKKKVLGIYSGRMEYGPRALGHRTIAAEPTDTKMMDWLNKRLVRTEFMPFAPIILEERAPDYFKNFEAGKYPAKFMTICFDCTDLAKKKAPGIVHKDGTARPQTVNRESNKNFYDLLKKYDEKIGLPISINTSFNKHEEPIVCRPEEAIKEFLRGAVDNLFIENYHIYK